VLSSPAAGRYAQREIVTRLPAWFLLTILLLLGANLLAGSTTMVTIERMRGVSAFAIQSRAYEMSLLPYWRLIAYGVLTPVIIAYLWPIVAWFRRGCPGDPPATVQRRAVSAPLVVSAVGFGAWMVSIPLFVCLTLLHFRKWSPDLMSQQVLSPLMNGFLAATTSFLVIDWIFRRMVMPRIFPYGRSADVPRTTALGVQGRLIVFLVAIGFVPLFTLFGLVRAAVVRVDAGLPATDVMHELARASGVTFGVFLVVGVVLTLVLSRTFTDPLGALAAVLRRVRAGDLTATAQGAASDEVGVLEDGVNALVATMREKERILATFGRVVEPSIRDRLLAGDLAPGGEQRTASVLFCDLRNFTSLAEHSTPDELVRTLNEFFSLMTVWARESGGFVDKFIGDGLLIVFGLFADGSGADGAAAAIRCAQGMLDRLVRLNADRTGTGRAPLGIKIGIHTGEVVAGLIGAADRHEYTVIGDTVNVASRLEQLCREHGCDLLVSETTWALAAGRGVPGEVTMRAAVALKGRDEPVRVFAIG
jgi:adenylate cyclase